MARLEDQGFAVFLPRVLAMRAIRPGVQAVKAVPAFPGYLFVRFDASADSWRSIPYTRGVKALFGSSPERPTPIPNRQVDALRAAADAPGADPRPALLASGVKVRVMDGAFADQNGVCLWDDGKRVGLLFDIMGAPRRVTVERRVVEAA